jgi:hypothetical protein
MSKIKITEEQLKRLTERRHSYTSNEGDVDESELTMNPDAEISEEEMEEGLKDTTPHPDKIKWSDFTIGGKVKIIRGVEAGEEGILDGLSMHGDNASVKLDRTGDIYATTPDCITPIDLVKNDEESRDMPGFEGTMDNLDDISLNESIMKIKSQFSRFL